jgi:trafficking protein particle complex subunit 9
VSRHSRVDLASLRPYNKEHQKSPFAHQPWDAECLRLKFVLGGCVPSPWEDFQSSRKVLAVVGICHIPSSPNLDRVDAEFVDAVRSYPSALANRCFAFCPTDAQVHARQLPPRLVQMLRIASLEPVDLNLIFVIFISCADHLVL